MKELFLEYKVITVLVDVKVLILAVFVEECVRVYIIAFTTVRVRYSGLWCVRA